MKQSHKLWLRLLALALCCGLIVSVTTGCCFCLPSSLTEKIMKKNDAAPVTQASDSLATRDEQDALASDPSEEVEATTTTTTTTQLPTIQTTQPAGSLPPLALQDMYVVAEGGLRMREQPNTSAKTITTIPNKTKVKVLAEEGDWSYIRYKNKEGWCSSDWLFHTYYDGMKTYPDSFPPIWVTEDITLPPTEGIYNEQIVKDGLQTANNIIRSYFGQVVPDAITKNSLTVAEVLALYDFAHYLTSANDNQAWAAHLIPTSSSPLYLIAGVMEDQEWRPGRLAGFDDYYDLCESFFSCLSDKLVYAELSDGIAIIDGQMYGGFRPEKGEGWPPSTVAYRVEQDGDRYLLIVTAWYYDIFGDPDELVETASGICICEKEDGAWVFTTM